MNFIFQYGDFFNETSYWSTIISFIGSILGALIAGLTALWVYKKGEKKRAEVEKQRLLDIDNFFRVSLKYLVPSINDLKGQLKREIKYLKSENIQQSDLFIHVGLKTTREINQINHTDLFKIYISDLRIRIDDYRKGMNSIILIDDYLQLIEKLRKGYRIFSKEIEQQFAKEHNALKYELADFCKLTEDANDYFSTEFNRIVDNYSNVSKQSTNEKKVFLLKSLLVEPLSELLETNFDDSKKKMLVLCTNLKGIFWKMSEQRKRTIKYYQYLEREFESLEVSISNFLDAVENRRPLLINEI